MRGMVSKTGSDQPTRTDFVEYSDDASFLASYPEYAEKPMRSIAEIQQDKIYLDFQPYLANVPNRKFIIQTRHDIKHLLDSQYMRLQSYGLTFHVHHIFAEPKESGAAFGVVIGCVIGILFGPTGMVIGAAFAALDAMIDNSNSRACARIFNTSRVWPGNKHGIFIILVLF